MYPRKKVCWVSIIGIIILTIGLYGCEIGDEGDAGVMQDDPSFCSSAELEFPGTFGGSLSVDFFDTDAFMLSGFSGSITVSVDTPFGAQIQADLFFLGFGEEFVDSASGNSVNLFDFNVRSGTYCIRISESSISNEEVFYTVSY